MESIALERWLQAWGVLTMLISSGFYELNILDKEAVTQSNSIPRKQWKIHGEEIYRARVWL